MNSCNRKFRAMVALAALALASAPALSQETGTGSEIAQAFCQREPFALATPSEVLPFLDYLVTLRGGMTEPPSPDCPNTRVRELFTVLSAPSLEAGEPLRDAFFARFVEGAEDLPTDRRYLNDAELASFFWLFCSGGERESCVEDLIDAQPEGFVASSPVFCDFAASPRAGVSTREPGPLVCSGEADAPARQRWHDELGRYTFG